MASTFTWQRPSETGSVGLIKHAKDSETPGSDFALDRLVGELVRAFFIAMAAMWVVTTIAAIFA
ncbi:MAG: hypothetical protein WBQ86_15255 [Candidatus Binatus sp.]